MDTFRTWLEGRDDHIPAAAIKVRLPRVRQQTSYTCGAAALRSVAAYYGVDVGSEDEFAKRLGSDQDDGTRPREIAAGARRLGLRAMIRDGMSVGDLKAILDHRVPIIVPIQAYGEEGSYWADDSSGHYVVVVGHGDGNLYFVDPSMDGGFHGFLPEKEFVSRWHDRDADGERCRHMGIVIWSTRGRRADWAERGAKKIP